MKMGEGIRGILIGSILLILFGFGILGRIKFIEIVSNSEQHKIDRLKYEKQLVECIKNANSEKQEKICALEFAMNTENYVLFNKLK